MQFNSFQSHLVESPPHPFLFQASGRTASSIQKLTPSNKDFSPHLSRPQSTFLAHFAFFSRVNCHTFSSLTIFHLCISFLSTLSSPYVSLGGPLLGPVFLINWLRITQGLLLFIHILLWTTHSAESFNSF